MSSDAQHTPGPWSVNVVETCYNAGIDPGSLSVSSTFIQEGMQGNMGCVCVVAPPQQTTAMDVANAHLIAAAPDLLKACKAAMRDVEYHSHTTVKLLADAIAKAENKT